MTTQKTNDVRGVFNPGTAFKCLSISLLILGMLCLPIKPACRCIYQIRNARAKGFHMDEQFRSDG